MHSKSSMADQATLNMTDVKSKGRRRQLSIATNVMLEENFPHCKYITAYFAATQGIDFILYRTTRRRTFGKFQKQNI